MLINGDCLIELKKLPDKSVDFFYFDLPYGETNCKWDTRIDLELLWKEILRIAKHDRVAYVFSCSTKFGYTLIKSNPKMFKIDLVWKKRNKTGGIYSRYRPMKNHEMLYFFYKKAPKYNRDKYHKRLKKLKPPNPVSVIETKINSVYPVASLTKDFVYGDGKFEKKKGNTQGTNNFDPPNPASVIETNASVIESAYNSKYTSGVYGVPAKEEFGATYTPPNPPTIFESKKVFVGKRNHQTEKPLDLMEFLLKYWTDEGDVVLDATMGVQCVIMNRKFIGIEKDPKIFKTAQKRIELKK